MTNNRQKYTEEFKLGAVKMVLDEKMSRAEVARRLGVSDKNISRWVKEQQSRDGGSTLGEQESVDGLRKKITALEKENRRLQMEREILKKATAFFANQSD